MLTIGKRMYACCVATLAGGTGVPPVLNSFEAENSVIDNTRCSHAPCTAETAVPPVSIQTKQRPPFASNG